MDNSAIPANPSPEEFLRSVLLGYYNGVDVNPFAFEFNLGIQDKPEWILDISRGLTAEHDELKRTRQDLTEHLAGVDMRTFSLRPEDGKNKNVLGRVYRNALKVTDHHKLPFSSIAVGIGKAPSINGRTFRHSNGATAIVLGFGCFSGLFSINHLMALVVNPRALSTNRSDPIGLLRQMLPIVSQYLGKGVFVEREDHLPDYRSMEELTMVHEWTIAQLQLILLHEFGHIALMAAASTEGSSAHADLELELAADRWAADCLKQRGDELCPLSAQLNAFFWLFEYMNLIETCEERKIKDQLTARARFDSIVAHLDPERVHIPGHYTTELRENFDLICEHVELFIDRN